MTGPAPNYTGKLGDLLPVITKEAETMRAAWPLERQWARRVLKGGAEVAVRIDQNGHRYLRISRTRTPDGEKAWRAWRAELGTFHHHLGTEDWVPYEERQDNGIAATFAEPQPEPALPEEPQGGQGIVTHRGAEGPTDSTKQPPKSPPAGTDEAAYLAAKSGKAANPGAAG
jgi:hypothetical protein